MKHSEFSIQLLVERLTTKAFNDRTPKKYASDMFEAAEVIQHLQKENKKLKSQHPQGRWIQGGDDQDSWHCSECGHDVLPADDLSDPYELGVNFCERCGAKMEKEQKDV